MAKFHGKIGFAGTEETAPGIHTEVIISHDYYGDVIRNTRAWEKAEHLNDNLAINNQFSIVGDAFAYGNFQNMRYVEWMGSLWKITNVEIQRPRLILTVGGVYNGTAN